MTLSIKTNNINKFKDNLFNNIDIESCLNNKHELKKTQEEYFLYKESINECVYLPESIQIPETSDDLYNKINKNIFNIKIEELTIVSKYGCYKLINRFRIINLLGSGSFSIVLKVEDLKDNIIYALKIISKNSKNNFDYSREAYVHSKLNHKHILKLCKIINNDDYLYIIMEYLKGGSLRDLIIKRYVNGENYLFSEEECNIIIKCILDGINYLHVNNIIHRDIKPENIMFDDINDLSSVKIADFGMSINTLENTERECVGTIIFMSPELHSKKLYDETIDIWAVGIILFILISGGRHPIYKPKMILEVFSNNINSYNDWEFNDNFSILVRNLFLKLCNKDKFCRYDSYKAMKHPWITRDPKSLIPMTLIESIKRKMVINEFRSLLATSIFICYIKKTKCIRLKKNLQLDENIIKINGIESDVHIYKLMSNKSKFSKTKNYSKNLSSLLIPDLSNNAKEIKKIVPKSSKNLISVNNLNTHRLKKIINSVNIIK